MSIKSAINSRRQEKANKITETVSACRQHIQQNYDRDLRDMAKLEREIPEDLSHGKEIKKAGATEAELEALARQINNKKLQLFHLKSSKNIFNSTYSVLVELEAIIHVVARHEWYRYIIRFVPYKRLPDMIKAENSSDITTIFNLVKSANAKLKQKGLSALHTEEERREFNEHLEKEMEIMYDMYGSKTSSTSMFDDDEAEAVNPTPTSVNADNATTNSNTAF